MSLPQKKILNWGKINFRKFPWRKPKQTPFKIFLAEMLLKRTTAEAASRVYPKILKKTSSLNQLIKTNEAELEDLIKPIGYVQRISEMILAAKTIQKNFSGRFPKEKSLLVSIPYIGDYTASAILSLAFNKPFAMVDSNVNRIINRVFFGRNPPPYISKQIKEISSEILPQTTHKQFNFAMLDIGGLLCKPRYPKCEFCPLEMHCLYAKNNN